MKVFVVEDSPIVRDRLIAMLLDMQSVEVVGQADNRIDAVRGIVEQRPDIVVLDIKLRDGTGIDVLQDIKQKLPAIETIMLTNYATAEFRRRCMSLGAGHFFDKTGEFERIKDVLADMMGRAPA